MKIKNDSPVKDDVPLPVPRIILPGLVEFVAHGTGVGKSLLATFAYWLYLQMGYQVTLVRIESRAVRRDGADIVIDTEAFARAAQLKGGVAGVLQPLFGALTASQAQKKGVVIVDWGGGQSEHRASAYAATRFGATLVRIGISGVTAIVTTATVDHMKQAADNLRMSELIVPEIRRVLVQNRHAGDFIFEPGSNVRATFDSMMHQAKAASIMKIADVDGESWKCCSDAGLTMAQVVAMPIADLMQRLHLDRFLAQACQSQVSAWMESTEESMLKSLADRDAGKP
jgi:hypothetical protein